MSIKYRISTDRLKLKEYGRNIQMMADYAKTIEDKDKRTRAVKEIIRIMSHLNPQFKDMPDYKQKLWDHLHAISDFELEVDSPFPKPAPEDIRRKPDEKLPYHKCRPRFKQYGWNVELMIKRATEMEEGPERVAYINLIANTMKQILRNMDKESTPEETIAEHMNDISKGKLKVVGNELVINKPTYTHRSHRNNGHSNKNRGRNNKGKNNYRKGGRRK